MIEPYIFTIGTPATLQVVYRRRIATELEVLHRNVDRSILLAEVQHKDDTEMLSDEEMWSKFTEALEVLCKREKGIPPIVNLREVEILFNPGYDVSMAKSFSVISSRTIGKTQGARLLEVIIMPL